jgi:TonB family protein
MRSGKSTKDGYGNTVGIIFSLLLHIVVAVVVLRAPPPKPPVEPIISVTIEPPSFLQPKTSKKAPEQIVSPSQAKEAVPPEETRLLSEKDSATEKEQIRRGDEGGFPGQQSTSAQSQASKQSGGSKASEPRQEESPKRVVQKEPKPPQEKRPQEKPLEPPQKPVRETMAKNSTGKLTDLHLDNSTLAKKFGGAEPADPEQAKSSSPEDSKASAEPLSDYRAFSRPPGSGAAFLGQGGINDHLPNLPDGDITMLNAKANTYAGFVRRVAVQVFSQLRSRGWERLSAFEIRQMSDFTTVEAVLSPEGRLLAVKILEGSGSANFDSVLEQSAQAGAKDPNPPPGARAEDGNIHFIFKARSWSSSGANPRGGGFSERRWLLLATGLE